MRREMNKTKHEVKRKGILRYISIGFLAVLMIACGGENRFEKEVRIEKSAVKLSREVMQGGYKLVTTEELKRLLDNKASILLIDTMPFEDSYQKNHIPTARQFLFPIPPMSDWDAQETGGKRRKILRRCWALRKTG